MADEHKDSSETEFMGPQPDICRDTTNDGFEEGEGQPDLCFDPPQAKEKVAPAGLCPWQAPSGGAPALPSLLTSMMPPPQVSHSAGQPSLMLLGMHAAAKPAPEPVKPAAKAAAVRQAGRPKAPKVHASPAPPPPPGACALAQDADALRLWWTVDARKLRKNERVIVSPLFDLPVGRGAPVPFRLMLFPSRGAGSFRASRGAGTMLLKCEATAHESPDRGLDLRFVVGRQTPRGPVRHSFAQSGVCSLPEEQQEWSFARAVDQASQTLGICLEVAMH